MLDQQHRMEVKILQREFVEAGFSLVELTFNPVFRDALSEYSACKITFDEFLETMEKTAILNPRLKS